MDAASHTGVDDIREVIDSVQYRAIVGAYKVFIIDEVHMLSKSAFNALLKTLEEPPSHVLFIFATTEINKIPETILSRCARFDLKRVESQLLIDHFRNIAQLEGYAIEQDALAMLARTADGSVRDGLTLLDQAMNLTDAAGGTEISSAVVQSMVGGVDRQRLYGLLDRILKKQPENAIEHVRSIVNDGADPIAIMQDLLECLYRVACFKVIPKLASDVTIPEFERKLANSAALTVESMQVLGLWKKMLKGFDDVKKAPYAGQALEMVVLRLCFAASIPSLDAWMAAPDVLEGPGSAVAEVLEGEGNGAREALGSAVGAHELRPSDVSNLQSGEINQGNFLPGAAQDLTQGNLSPAQSNLQTEIKQGNLSPYAEQDNFQPEINQTNPLPEAAQCNLSPEPAQDATPRSCNSLDDLLQALETNREALLLSYVSRDFAFVSFESGKILVQLKNKESKKVIPLLKQFLLSFTGFRWTIDVDSSDNVVQSLQEQHNAQLSQKEQDILKGPFIRKVLKEFPAATVSFTHDGE
jgi:DNA polymerase-3 subunit gamma/tau